MKQTDLLKPTSNKIKNETNTAANILKKKNLPLYFLKIFRVNKKQQDSKKAKIKQVNTSEINTLRKRKSVDF